MTDSWTRVRLEDVVDLLTGFPFQSAHYTEDGEFPRLLRGDNIGQGRLRWDGVKRWPGDDPSEDGSYWLNEGDLVLAMDRPWIEAGLKFAEVRTRDKPCLLVQRVARMRGTADLDVRYLKYVIGGPEFTNHVLAVQTGTAVPHISATQIKEFEFELPTIAEQYAVAAILGALDDKIELSRRLNETLEATARAIFKSWFVDFDPVRAKVAGREPTNLPKPLADVLPSRFVASELGEIPEGWSVKPLDEGARFLNGLALQKYPPNGDRSLPVIKIAQLRAGNTVNAERASADLDRDYVVNDGDILFSWSGSLECVIWAGGRGALNQHLFKVTSEVYPKWFIFGAIHKHLPEFRQIAAGKATTMGHIRRHHLSEAMVVVPSDEVLRAADHAISPFFNRVLQTDIESRTLAGLRDALLPKLISGELRVKDAERFVEAVA